MFANCGYSEAALPAARGLTAMLTLRSRLCHRRRVSTMGHLETMLLLAMSGKSSCERSSVGTSA